jgi:hypothetical protein
MTAKQLCECLIAYESVKKDFSLVYVFIASMMLGEKDIDKKIQTIISKLNILDSTYLWYGLNQFYTIVGYVFDQYPKFFSTGKQSSAREKNALITSGLADFSFMNYLHELSAKHTHGTYQEVCDMSAIDFVEAIAQSRSEEDYRVKSQPPKK